MGFLPIHLRNPGGLAHIPKIPMSKVRVTVNSWEEALDKLQPERYSVGGHPVDEDRTSGEDRIYQEENFLRPTIVTPRYAI